MTTSLDSQSIIHLATAYGFAAAGIAAVAPMDPAPLRDWLAAGYGAEMAYLHRHLPLRADLTALLPGARSVICTALPYPGPTVDETVVGTVARYTRGADYHDVMRQHLARLWEELRRQHPTAEGRIFVDSGPLPERELARRAGVGWPGRHGCLISPTLGSRFVLGEILTTLAITPTAPLTGDCGACRRCLAACPTGALVAPGVVDARRCLAYLTIEHRGPIPRALRPGMGWRLFGCDTCQDVCPHNAGKTGMVTPFTPAQDLLSPDLPALLAMTPEAFRQRFRGTALARAKRGGLLRNACIVLGNLGDPAMIPPLTMALGDTDPLVRGHAAWALGRLSSTDAVRRALLEEPDSWVRDECLASLPT